MNILLTGGTGFIGKYLLNHLLENKHHKLTVIVRNNEGKNKLKRIVKKYQSLSIIVCNLNDHKKLEDVIKLINPEIVIHNAWEGVLSSMRNSEVQFLNVGNSLKLYEYCRKSGMKRWVGIGSQAEYGPVQYKINEEQKTLPTTLYGACKLAVYNLTKVESEIFNIEFVWIRIFSTYGPGEDENWLISYITNKLIKNETPKVTKCEQKWDYIYIQDLVDAIYSVIFTKKARGVFNIGSGNAIELKKITEHIRKYLNKDLEIDYGAIEYRTDQIMYLQADISKITNVTGWRPKQDIYSGIEKTIDSISK